MGNKLGIIARIKAGLLLGGVGYGLAEGTFAPLDWAVRILAAVSPAFRDMIYREATKGYDLMHSAANLTIRALMVVAVGYFSLWSANYLLKRFTNWESSLTLFKFARRNMVFNLLAVAIVLGSLMVNMQLNYSKQVMTYSMDSIEVLAPEIPNATRLRLRLDFFCIRDAEDFYLLNDELHKLSESTGTTLPAFNPV